MLHLALAQIVQVRLPMPVIGQIFRHMSGQKNVSGIATLQHALRDIHSRSCKVRFVIHIDDSIDWSTVNPHSYLDVAMILQGPANLESTSHWFLGTLKEKERHPIACRHSTEFAACLRCLKTFRISHDLIQFLENFDLLVDEQFRITHHID